MSYLHIHLFSQKIVSCLHIHLKTPPTWQENDLVSGGPWAGMAKLGDGVDNELGASAAPVQISGCGLNGALS